jgi:hypothetical protein
MSYGSYDPQDIPLARNSDVLVTFRFKVVGREDEVQRWSLEQLVNLVPVTITIREGAHAPLATFRYIFDQDLMPPELPTRFHHVYGNVPRYPGVVQMDDRLVVMRVLDDGSWQYMFDGFVTSPQARADGQGGEHVIVVAHGAPHREWDFVLPGAVWAREMIDAQDDKIRPVFTDAPARFNPLGKPNACAEGEEFGGPREVRGFNVSGDFLYFKDTSLPGFVTPSDNDKYTLPDGAGGYVSKDIRHWTVADAARWVVAMGIEGPLGINARGELLRPTWMRNEGAPFVSVYDIEAWGERLKVIVPKKDGKAVDLGDPKTYEKLSLKCPDVEVTGEAWPNALEKIIRPYGFNFRFDLRTAKSEGFSDGFPEWMLTIYRVDDKKNRVRVYLQSPGDIYNPGRTNVAEVDMSRDAFHVGNEFEVDSGLTEFEATFLLAPGFPIAAADKDDLEQWKGEHEDAAKRDRYRLFVFGEGGRKYWNGTKMTQQADDAASLGGEGPEAWMKRLFGMVYEKDDPRLLRRWGMRARPPLGKLIVADSEGRPKWLRLDVCDSKANNQKAPDLWNGTGTWQRVTGTHWRALDDCIGVRLHGVNPNEWHAGHPRDGDTIVFDGDDTGVLNLVEWLADPAADKVPMFALTCVIQSDVDLGVLAPYRRSSISGFRVRRRIDAKDRWKRKIVTKFSMAAREDADADALFQKGVNYLDIRDDTANAKDGALGYQRAHEAGAHGGSFTIRRITTAYNVGQLVTGVVGRNVDMRINAGAPKGETPLYPRIASITWNFDGDQTTTLHLTDERADPITRRQAMTLRVGRQR